MIILLKIEISMQFISFDFFSCTSAFYQTLPQTTIVLYLQSYDFFIFLVYEANIYDYQGMIERQTDQNVLFIAELPPKCTKPDIVDFFKGL